MTQNNDAPDCTSPKTSSGPLAVLWAYGAGRESGCANIGPWWTNAFPPVVAGSATYAVLALTILTDNPHGAAAVGVALTLIWYAVARVLDPARYHESCDECGQCSVGAGIPAQRTIAESIRVLRTNGWTFSGDGLRAWCPKHPRTTYTHVTGN